MSEKRFIVLETVEVMSIEQGSVYIEKTSFGVVVIVNLFNFENGKNYIISLTDADGHNYTHQFNSNYISFSLGGFIIQDDIYVEIYKNNELVLRGYSECKNENDNIEVDGSLCVANDFTDDRLSASEYAKETNQTEILDEARAILEKYKNLTTATQNSKLCTNENVVNNGSSSSVSAKQLFSDELTDKQVADTCNTCNCSARDKTFYDTIKDEFELLFSAGTDFPFLSKRFGGVWKRVSSHETLILAKFYSKPQFLLNTEPMPDIVAIAMPILLSNSQKNLGTNSIIYKVDECGDFAYNILFQYATDGKAIKINCD